MESSGGGRALSLPEGWLYSAASSEGQAGSRTDSLLIGEHTALYVASFGDTATVTLFFFLSF